MRLFVVFLLIGAAFGQWDPHFVRGRNGIVHLFEWHWDTIADECETFLSEKNFAGVQVFYFTYICQSLYNVLHKFKALYFKRIV